MRPRRRPPGRRGRGRRATPCPERTFGPPAAAAGTVQATWLSANAVSRASPWALSAPGPAGWSLTFVFVDRRVADMSVRDYRPCRGLRADATYLHAHEELAPLTRWTHEAPMRVELATTRRCGSPTTRPCAPPPASRRTARGGWSCRTMRPTAASGDGTGRALSCRRPWATTFDEASEPRRSSRTSRPSSRSRRPRARARLRVDRRADALVLLVARRRHLRGGWRRLSRACGEVARAYSTSSTSRAPAWWARAALVPARAAVRGRRQRQRRRRAGCAARRGDRWPAGRGRDPHAPV